MNPITPPSELTSLSIVLSWLAAGGGVYVCGIASAYLLANWAWWNGLPSLVKKGTPVVLAVLISIGSTILLQQAGFLAIVQPWYAIVMQTLLLYGGSQQAYFKSIKPVMLQAKALQK